MVALVFSDIVANGLLKIFSIVTGIVAVELLWFKIFGTLVIYISLFQFLEGFSNQYKSNLE